MAIQTRYAGDAFEVNNVDNTAATTGTLIATGLTKNPIAIKIISGVSNFAAAEMATGGSVETILRNLAIDGTVVMYQVDAGQLSILCEATGNTTTNIGARIQALGNASVAGGSNVWANTSTVSSSNGFKLA